MVSENMLTLLLTLLFFIITSIIILNWLLLYNGFKKVEVNNEVLKGKTPLLLAGNIAIVLSVFILYESYFSFVTYQLTEADGLVDMFINSSIILLINTLVLFVSYMASQIVIKYILGYNNTVLKSIIWLSFTTIILILINEYYVQYTSSNAFTIY